MKKIFSLLFFSLLFLQSKAQTDPLYAQYMNNPILINPAYAGLNEYFSASVSYRKQWAGFEGSPTTINMSAQSSLMKNRMGAGLILLKDDIGVNSNTEIQATYAYKINFEDKTISFGLQAGIINYRINNNELNVYDPNDPAFSNVNVVKPTIGGGVIFKSDKYFFGFSVPRMLQPTSNGSEQFELYNRHFYGVASYLLFINEYVSMKPSVLVKGVSGSPPSFDVNMAMILKGQYTIGVFARNFETYGFLSQIKINDRYKVGYVFEVPTNRSVGTHFISHELTLGLNMSLFRFHDLDKAATF